VHSLCRRFKGRTPRRGSSTPSTKSCRKPPPAATLALLVMGHRNIAVLSSRWAAEPSAVRSTGDKMGGSWSAFDGLGVTARFVQNRTLVPAV
jgi:hypothetical protein